MPSIGSGEILVEVTASGICGSDVMEWYRRPTAPAVLGHEVAGRVLAVADGVQQYRVGDRVVVTHHVPCMVCRYCLTGRETVCDTLRQTHLDPGGLAQLVRVPAVNVERGVLRLPAHVSDEAGSLVEPLGCVLRAQRKAGVGGGDSVLIIGCGVSGCLHLMAAKGRGAAPILAADIEPTRRAVAARLGADFVLAPGEPIEQQVRRELGHGADRVIVCTGARSAVVEALRVIDRGGTVLFFAPMGPGDSVPLPFDDVFWRHDATVTSSYGAGLADLTQALTLIAAKRVDVGQLITHRLPLHQIQRGFELVATARDSLKVIVNPRL